MVPLPHLSKIAVKDPLQAAFWLLRNTRLANRQIAAFCGIDGHSALDDWRGNSDHPDLDPIAAGVLVPAEIARCEADPSALLELRIGDCAASPEIDLWSAMPRGVADRAHKVSPVKLYSLEYGRNAWHSTWINRYRARSIGGMFGLVQRLAEDKRVQGSEFKIREIPAAAFQGREGTLLVLEINKSFEMERLHDIGTVPLLFDRLAAHFAGAAPNSVLTLLARGNIGFQPLRNGTPLVEWLSIPRGTGRGLEWRKVVLEPFSDVRLETLIDAARCRTEIMTS